MDIMENTSALVLPRGTENVDVAQGSVFFIGTATVLLCYAGFTILTDPNFLHQVRAVAAIRPRTPLPHA